MNSLNTVEVTAFTSNYLKFIIINLIIILGNFICGNLNLGWFLWILDSQRKPPWFNHNNHSESTINNSEFIKCPGWLFFLGQLIIIPYVPDDVVNIPVAQKSKDAWSSDIGWDRLRMRNSRCSISDFKFLASKRPWKLLRPLRERKTTLTC